MARGTAWMMLFKLIERSLGLISVLILVRLLVPEDFGIVAMAVSFIAMAELLSAFGFDLALIHRQDATESHYHTAWTCNVLLGLVITAVMVALAQPIAEFYGRSEVFWVVCALAVGASIGGLENIGIVAFRKDLQFHKEFVFLLSKKLAGVLITVPLAFWLRSYWALVVGMLTSRLWATAISYAVHPFRPRWSLASIGELMHFSKWIFINNVVIFFKERTTDFVIGSLKGPAALGLYNVSSEFSNLPLTELAAPMNRALLPAFAKIKDDQDGVRAAFNNTIGILALIAVPAAAGICAVAPLLVPVILGPNWLKASQLMEVLSLAGGVVLFHSPICSLLIASGWPDAVARCHAAFVGLLIAGLLLLVPDLGELGAAYAALAAAVIATPAYLWHLRKHVGIGVTPLLRAIARPVLASIVMVLAVRHVLSIADPGTGVAGQALLLVFGIGVGMIVYAAVISVIWLALRRPGGAEQIAVEQLRSALARRRTQTKDSA
ncbi:MAG: lipopolysaccharide biosynthesis protein [Burkholderiales bacterium]